jgi:hypothetical protein
MPIHNQQTANHSLCQYPHFEGGAHSLSNGSHGQKAQFHGENIVAAFGLAKLAIMRQYTRQWRSGLLGSSA